MSDADKPTGTAWPMPSFNSLHTWFPWLNSPRPEGEARETPPLEAQFNDMRDTWMASLSKWTRFASEAARGDTPGAEQLREIFVPAAWMGSAGGAVGLGLQRMLEGPRYATLWDLDRKLAELQQSTLQRNKDVAEYQAVLQKAWGSAFERFAKAVASTPRAADQLTWRRLTGEWLAIANETLVEVFRSEDFLEAQRRMLRSAADQRLQERKIAEAWCEAVQVPTRSEVDELQRLVIELRREVRTLRRGTTAPKAEDTPQRETRGPARRRTTSAQSRS